MLKLIFSEAESVAGCEVYIPVNRSWSRWPGRYFRCVCSVNSFCGGGRRIVYIFPWQIMGMWFRQMRKRLVLWRCVARECRRLIVDVLMKFIMYDGARGQ